MNVEQKPKIPIIRMVLLTSLPSYILAEVFFGFLYFLVISGAHWLHYFLSITTTAQIEANMDIFSPVNIVIFLIGMSLISVIMCLEILTIIAITTYDYYRNDHIPLKVLMHYAFQKMRGFLRFRTAPFFVFLFFFPKAQIAPKTLLALNIPPFIIDELVKFPLYFVLIVAILCGIGYFVYRSLFVLHFLFLERTTVSRAFVSSFRLTQKLGFRKIFRIVFQNIFWIFLFILPVIAFGIALSRIITTIDPWLGNGAWIVYDAINFLMEFLFLGLSSALFLAGLTIAYIRYSGYQKSHFESRFHFLKTRPTFTPRWKNVRQFFQKKYFLAVVFGLMICSPLFLSMIVRAERQDISFPMIISHRGVSEGGYIENTLSGIIEAKKQGAKMVEIDIYENADGTLVLSHDPDLERIANDKRKIAHLTDGQIASIRLSNNERIPTLEMVLKMAKMYDISLLIEPKIHGHEKNLIPTLVKLLEESDMISRVKIHSFNIEMLKEMKKRQPHLQVGLIIFAGFGYFGATEVDFFSLQERVVTSAVVKNIHQFEKQIYVWTLNDTSDVSRYMKMGVDGIITDKIIPIQTKIDELFALHSSRPQTVFRFFGYEIYSDDILGWFRKEK